MSGEIHILPAEDLERIKRIEYARGVRDGYVQRAALERITKTPFGKRLSAPPPSRDD